MAHAPHTLYLPQDMDGDLEKRLVSYETGIQHGWPLLAVAASYDDEEAVLHLLKQKVCVCSFALGCPIRAFGFHLINLLSYVIVLMRGGGLAWRLTHCRRVVWLPRRSTNRR